MDKEKVKYIDNLIDNLKVISYTDKEIESNTTFLKLKEGYYELNNNETIRRESVIRRVGAIDAVAMFAITNDKEILLVIQPRVALPTETKVDIELPAGYIEKDEDILDAAARELKEETGYIAQNMIKIDSYYPSLGYSGEKIHIVLSLGCEKKSEQNLDKDEFVSFIKVNIKEFKYLLENGYILDATARLAYYRTLEYLTNNSMLNMIGE